MEIDIVTPPQHGRVSAVTADGKVTYTSEPGYEGADSFTYRATQDVAVSETVRADVTVTKQDITKPPPDDDKDGAVGGARPQTQQQRAYSCRRPSAWPSFR